MDPRRAGPAAHRNGGSRLAPVDLTPRAAGGFGPALVGRPVSMTPERAAAGGRPGRALDGRPGAAAAETEPRWFWPAGRCQEVELCGGRGGGFFCAVGGGGGWRDAAAPPLTGVGGAGWACGTSAGAKSGFLSHGGMSGWYDIMSGSAQASAVGRTLTANGAASAGETRGVAACRASSSVGSASVSVGYSAELAS
eukprot:scaffold7756_cov93-Isochrysis_galbana.AAC.2